MSRSDIEKRAAAAKAAEFVKDGMLLGLGSGSTFEYTLQEVATKVKEGRMHVLGIASSERTATLAREYGIQVVDFEPGTVIDLTIDGADEVDEAGTMIKGGGAALLREKIVARFSRHVLIAVDSSKIVRHIGKFPLPVEVLPFGVIPVGEAIKSLGADVRQRLIEGRPLVTDNGHYILDCSFGQITDGAALDARLKQIPGVVETGIFAGLLDTLVIGHEDGSAEITTF